MELSKSDTTGIKGIAILFMLWHHLFLNAQGYEGFTHSLAVVSKVCVALFLFVSGYGLTKQYGGLEQRNVWTTTLFLLRRYINFFFPYWFCFILVVLVGNICGYSFNDAYPATRNSLKCFLLDLFGQMGYDSYLKPWWFNKMIIQLYLVFPILYMIMSSRSSSIISLVAVAILQLFAKSLPGNVFFIVEGGVPAFSLGIIVSRFRIIPNLRKNSRKYYMASFFVLIGISLSIFWLKVVKDPYQAILVRALLAFCIVCIYKFFAIVNFGVLCLVGRYATIMYLTHELIIILFPKVVYYPRFSGLVFVFFVFICLAVAISIDWLKRVTLYDKLRLNLSALVKV